MLFVLSHNVLILFGTVLPHNIISMTYKFNMAWQSFEMDDYTIPTKISLEMDANYSCNFFVSFDFFVFCILPELERVYSIELKINYFRGTKRCFVIFFFKR